MYRNLRIAFIVASLSPLVLPYSSSAQQSRSRELLEPEDREVSVMGTIRLVHDFGPPGFGEDPKHDSHVSYWALETPSPINTPCVPQKSDFAGQDCAPAKRMKLFFSGHELDRLNDLPAAKWKDREVVVRGRLHRADTAGEMTSIYMDVIVINQATH